MATRAVSGLASGTVVDGRYRLESQVGAGGMAIVYRATHLRLGKTVALKVMSPSLADDHEFRRRFEDEAREVFDLDHPHVIPVYDFGEFERALYIVMRYVDGQNLRELLRQRGPLDPARAVQVTEEVASALDAAHARDLLHRDVKPANILVEDSTSRIFLADFGLVRSVRAGDETRTKSRLLGTDWYMAPERRRGEETRLGDVYSLGCVLWEMLAGPGCHLPGHSALTDGDSVPPRLRAVAERAVRERPRERFGSCGELAHSARRALGGGAGVEPRRTPEVQVLHQPLSAELSARVAELCTETLAATIPADARHELERIRRRVGEPLALALAGRVSAGKSTLVNALLGRRIAQTGAEETTRVVAWYRWGERERCELVLTGEARRRLDLTPEGLIPDSVGVAPEDVTAIEMQLPLEALRGMTIVDTPGLDPTDVEREPRVELPRLPSPVVAPDETAAIRRADAILFAMAGDAVAADREALEAFRGRFEDTGHASAVNVIGVLTKADLASSDSASWAPAVERAGRLREALGALISDVVPVAGRLAETAETGRLTDDDVDCLTELAGLDTDDRERLLESVEAFSGDTTPVAGAQRLRLLALLGRFGVRRAIELVQAGDQFNRVALNRRLRELSGIEELRKALGALQLRADLLKADAALVRLEALSWRHGLVELRDRVDRLRIEEPLLDLVRGFDECANGAIDLEPGRLEELERLLTGRTLAERLGLEPEAQPQDMRATAARRMREWREWAGSGMASFQGRQVAARVDDVYTKIALS